MQREHRDGLIRFDLEELPSVVDAPRPKDHMHGLLHQLWIWRATGVLHLEARGDARGLELGAG